MSTLARIEAPVLPRDVGRAALRISLLGSGSATIGGRPVVMRGHPKMWPVLAFLALRAGELVEREALAAAVWPDVPDDTARSNLRRHLLYLSDALNAHDVRPWFAREGTKIGLDGAQPIWVDTAAFLEAGADETRLAEAAAMYGGPLLAGLADDWIVAERGRLHERYHHVLERLIAIERKSGDIGAALDHAVSALCSDPFREDMVRTLMRLRLEAGDRAGALREYERFSALLHAELQAEPAPETQNLAAALRANETRMPATRAMPVEETSFIGRSADLSELNELLIDARLATVLGPPGVGKTRLALRFAHTAEAQFADGARFVDLTTATRDDEVERLVEAAFEDRAQPRIAKPIPIEQRLRKKHVLIVLDNCEQAAAACGRLVSRILRLAPRVRIVATSRCMLKVRGEAIFALRPLDDADATRLFVERARFARRGLVAELLDGPLTAAIVRATDGLPLALELSAARLRTLSLSEVAARLDFQNEALRASLESSYALLSDAERRLLRRLATFSDPIALDAARAVALDDASEDDAIAQLSQLVEQSLLVAPRIDAAEQRYGMLQPIREFAREKLERLEAEQRAVRARHARFFALRYVAQNDDLRGARAHEYFDRVAAEHGEVRAALRHLIVAGEDPVLGARLALALSRFWFDRGYVREGADWLEAVAASGALEADLRANVLHVWATLIRNLGDYQRAFELFGEVLAMLRDGADRRAAGKAFATYANAARMVGRFDVARAAAADALAHFTALDDGYLRAYALLTNGCVAFSSGDLAAARTHFERALALYRVADAEADVALALGNLGSVAYYENELDAATMLCTDAADRARSLENVYYEASAMLTLARIAVRSNDRAGAQKTLQATLELARAIEDKELLVGCLETAAWMCVDHDAARGATLLGAVDAAHDRYRLLLSPVEAAERDRLRARLAETLSANMYVAAGAAGSALALDVAVKRVVRTPLL